MLQSYFEECRVSKNLSYLWLYTSLLLVAFNNYE